jgi:hypothetical protein
VAASSKSQGNAKRTLPVPTDNADGEMAPKVDVNRNFNLLTAFGSLPVSIHMEEYVFIACFPALMHFFNLRFPIKKDEVENMQKLVNAIQRSVTFCKKD